MHSTRTPTRPYPTDNRAPGLGTAPSPCPEPSAARRLRSVRPRLTSRIFAAALLALLATGCEQRPAKPKHPNILVISVDTLRPDHMGCYGYRRDTSPRMDRLAAEGALFKNAISSTSWTLPAHAALFTGLPDSVHGCLDTDNKLADARLTLAERLKQHGYTTAGFFSGPYLHPVFGLGQGFDNYVDCTSYPDLNNTTAERTGTVDGRLIWDASHRDITNPTVYKNVKAWIDAGHPAPFFLFIHLWDVHFDFIPPAPYDTLFDPDYRGSVTGDDFLNNPRINVNMPKRDLEHLVALYDGEIRWTDLAIERILNALDARGLLDDTIIALLADHGTEFFEHGLKAHRQTLYDEVIRIPLILWYPPKIQAGARIRQQAHITDVLPTVLDLAGFGPTDDCLGKSLVPALSGETIARDVPCVSELFCKGGRLTQAGAWAPEDTNFPITHQLRAFRELGRKRIHDLNRDETLVFNLETDPAEQHPITDPADPTVIATGKDVLRARAWLADGMKAFPAPAESADVNDRIRKQLERLGYLPSDTRRAPDSQPTPTSAPAP
jgi:arylsulfatase A-like enzyme